MTVTGDAGRLNRRQQAVLGLVRDGLTARQIGVRLNLSREVVNREITAITARINARRTLYKVTR